MSAIHNISSLNWQNDLNKIVSSLQTTSSPFKVTSFFSDHDSIPRTKSEFNKIHAHIPLDIVRHDYVNFFSKIHKGDFFPLEKNTYTLEDFENQVNNDPSFKKISRCYENYIPKELVSFAANKLTFDDLKDLSDNRHEPSYYYRFFLGFEGQTTHPHIDWNCNNNILFQIYGKKRVLLFSPDVFVHLKFVMHFVENPLEEIIELMNKKDLPYYDIELNSGEGLHIPPYFLHSVLYPTDSCSLALRFMPRKSNLSVHRLLPANNKFSTLLNKWHKSGLDYSEQIEEICSFQKYSDLLKHYDRVCEENFEPHEIPETSLYSRKYEEFIFSQQQSFDYQIQVKKVRKEILERGASHFSF